MLLADIKIMCHLSYENMVLPIEEELKFLVSFIAIFDLFLEEFH